MLDVAAAYSRFMFLGNEFLTWIWYIIENEREWLNQQDPEMVTLDIGNYIILENRRKGGIEKISIKGDDAGLEEGLLALSKGALMTEANFVYKSGSHEWRFSLKGESMNISGLKPPESGSMETSDDFEGMVLEKLYLYEKVFQLVDKLYFLFIKLRLSDDWRKTMLPKIHKWVYMLTESGRKL